MSLARWPVLDIARACAILAMIVFHLTWDLGFFGIVDYDISFTPEGQLFAHLIAGSFLAIVGAGLALAHRRRFEPSRFLRRFRWLVAAALMVSAGTWITMPEAWIFFGVLHCITASNLLALPFLRAPLALVLACAVAVIFAPLVVAHPFFDQPALYFLGLNRILPETNDYVPLFPWFGIVLAGLAAGRFALSHDSMAQALARPRPSPLAKALARMGRFSLIIYLVHQPLLMGGLWLVTSLAGPLHIGPARDTALIRACLVNCVQKGRDAASCDASCTCIGEQFATLDRTSPNHDAAAFSARLDEAIAVCRARFSPPPQKP